MATPGILDFPAGDDTYTPDAGRALLYPGADGRWRSKDATGAVTLVEGVPAARLVQAGAGLSGGGDLSANRTLTNADRGSTAVAAHEALGDPHPQYVTPAEGQALFAPVCLAARSSLTAAITTTETSLVSASVSGMQVGTNFRFTAGGIVTNTTAASTLTIRLKIGGVAVCLSVMGLGTVARSSQPFIITGIAMIAAVGAAPTASGLGTAQIMTNLATAVSTGTTAALVTGFSTLVANTVDFTLQTSAGTSSLVVHNAALELLKA